VLKWRINITWSILADMQTERPYCVTNSKSTKIGRFTVVQDTLLIDGKEYPYSYLIESDCVCVMAVHNENIVLLRQYRHSANEWKLEFPCGAIDKGESAENAARRELLEETGCITDTLIPLGKQTMRAGVSTGGAYMFLAICKEMNVPKPDPSELIELQTLPVIEFKDMIENGNFEQMLGVNCWHRAQKHLVAKGFINC
jgi:ADP-ribose pyrophosphatase